MRVHLNIDSVSHQIDTRDPELLGRWLVEIFARVRWSPATWAQVQVYPSFVQTKDGAPPELDWIADSRIITNAVPVMSPQEFVNALQKYLDDAKELAK